MTTVSVQSLPDDSQISLGFAIINGSSDEAALLLPLRQAVRTVGRGEIKLLSAEIGRSKVDHTPAIVGGKGATRNPCVRGPHVKVVDAVGPADTFNAILVKLSRPLRQHHGDSSVGELWPPFAAGEVPVVLVRDVA